MNISSLSALLKSAFGFADKAYVDSQVGGGVIQTISTYSPTFTFATPGDLSVVYTTQSGHYVRIGDLVYVSMYLACTPTFSTASGLARVSLPFTQRNLTNLMSHFDFRPNGTNITPPGGTDSMLGVCEGNINYMTFSTFTAGELVGNLASTNFVSGGAIFLRFTGTFLAEA